MSNSRRAIPFLVVIVAFGLTAPCMWGAREPYPALLMPPFSLPVATDRALVTASVDITASFADGEVRHLSAGELLGPLPRTSEEPMLRAFRPESVSVARVPPDPEVRPGPLADRLLPGRRLHREFRAAGDRFVSDGARSWLRGRVERLGRGEARELRFAWFEEIIRPGAKAPVRGRHVGTYIMDLRR